MFIFHENCLMMLEDSYVHTHLIFMATFMIKSRDLWLERQATKE